MNQIRPDHQVLAGSHRAPTPGQQVLGPADPTEPVEVTLVLRRRGRLPREVITGPALDPAALGERYGADPADSELVTATLSGLGLQVIEADPASRRIRVAGPAGVLGPVFGADLQRVRSTDPVSGQPIEHRGRTGELSVPGALAGIVVAVLGLDDRPQSRTRLRRAAAAAATSYTPLQLATIYQLPEYDGSGQTLAIIELGGGFGTGDLDTYFGGLGVASPSVRAVSVDGAQNVPDQDPSGADGEVLLDIEVAGALAPAADLLVYFAPNTDAGFLDAISTAAHATPTPTAISISWGQSEDQWTAQARSAMDDALADAAALGVTVTVAAGDDGSTDNSTGVHTDFPAASPHVLACGGTTLHADPSTGQVSSETVWDNGTRGATGGGISDTFPIPDWQSGAGVPARSGGGTGRGVPDVAAVADPSTGYQVYIDGQASVIGGTSAVAPLWAALACRLAQALGARLGLLQPKLYAGASPGHTSTGFRDITSGNNGAYQAAPGWDACTGLGVPDGAALLEVLRAAG